METRNETTGVEANAVTMPEKVDVQTEAATMQESIEVQNIVPQVKVPSLAKDVLPLNTKAAMQAYEHKEQQEIIALANSIDVRKIDNVMAYGSEPLKQTFAQCGDFLKAERGSQADQKVIKQVKELAKKASDSYEDFNLVLREPNFFQKFMLGILNSGKKSRTKDIQNSAVTNYKLLAELRASCDQWMDMLKKACEEIQYSGESDVTAIGLLEKYIVAGQLAKERIEQELERVQTQYQETGLQKYSKEYELLYEGYKIFQVTMSNLEKSRVAYLISIAQLSLSKRSNRNVQIAISTQVNNSMTLISQQLRNAVLDAKTREVLEGQKAITRLNDELLKEVSKSVGITAKEAETLIYAGFYNLGAAKEAITTVINGCKEIERVATEMLPKMQTEMKEVEGLLSELSPYINSVETLKQESGSSAPTIVSTPTGGLKF